MYCLTYIVNKYSNILGMNVIKPFITIVYYYLSHILQRSGLPIAYHTHGQSYPLIMWLSCQPPTDAALTSSCIKRLINSARLWPNAGLMFVRRRREKTTMKPVHYASKLMSHVCWKERSGLWCKKSLLYDNLICPLSLFGLAKWLTLQPVLRFEARSQLDHCNQILKCFFSLTLTKVLCRLRVSWPWNIFT